MKASDVLRRLHRDPEFAARRDARARAVLAERGAEMRRRALIVRRGVDVPEALEADWIALKRKGTTNAEAARALGLPYTAPKRRTKKRKKRNG